MLAYMRHKVFIHPRARKEFIKLEKTIQYEFLSVFDVIEKGERLSVKRMKVIRKIKMDELRVKKNKNIYRAFGAFKNRNYFVVLFFQKKTQKIPKRYLKLAQKRFGEISS